MHLEENKGTVNSDNKSVNDWMIIEYVCSRNIRKIHECSTIEDENILRLIIQDAREHMQR